VHSWGDTTLTRLSNAFATCILLNSQSTQPYPLLFSHIVGQCWMSRERIPLVVVSRCSPLLRSLTCGHGGKRFFGGFNRFAGTHSRKSTLCICLVGHQALLVLFHNGHSCNEYVKKKIFKNSNSNYLKRPGGQFSGSDPSTIETGIL